jgi:hypothetical protein
MAVFWWVFRRAPGEHLPTWHQRSAWDTEWVVAQTYTRLVSSSGEPWFLARILSIYMLSVDYKDGLLFLT